MTGTPRIAHLFADCGVEGEALATVGTVDRYTLDPRPNPVNAEVVQMDLVDELPPAEYDLAFAHPPCTKWSDMPGMDPDDHDDLIPRAREVCETIADEYVIENKPRAPLNDPTYLRGQQFGLPIEYERAFETSFPVPQPPRQQTLGQAETSPFFYSERTTEWWAAVKGIRGDYPKEHVAKNALPLQYVDYLTRAWLDATGRAQGVGDYSDYDAENRRERRAAENEALTDI